MNSVCPTHIFRGLGDMDVSESCLDEEWTVTIADDIVESNETVVNRPQHVYPPCRLCPGAQPFSAINAVQKKNREQRGHHKVNRGCTE